MKVKLILFFFIGARLEMIVLAYLRWLKFCILRFIENVYFKVKEIVITGKFLNDRHISNIAICSRFLE